MKFFEQITYQTSDFGDGDCEFSTFYQAKSLEDVVNAIDVSGIVDENRNPFEVHWTFEDGKASFEVPFEGYPGYFTYAMEVREVRFEPVADGVLRAG